MQIVFSKARNGSETCAADGKFLHSSYNPEREAEQFVAHLAAELEPACVLIIEPALSYCLAPLRKRFPHAHLCAIRLCRDFAAYNSGWDSVFYAVTTADELSEALYSFLGEEKLCAMLSFSWLASEQVFKANARIAWEGIKSAVLKSRDVLYTRAFFAKRWSKNCVKFLAHAKRIACIERGSLPIIVAASLNRSGYSEEVTFQALKESGALEYTGDIVIGLQFQATSKITEKSKNLAERTKKLTAERNKSIRKMEAVILKHRNGKIGGKTYFDYIPKYNIYKEGLPDKNSLDSLQLSLLQDAISLICSITGCSFFI